MTFEMFIITLLSMFAIGSVIHSVLMTNMLNLSNKMLDYFSYKAKHFSTEFNKIKRENKFLKSQVIQMEIIEENDLPELIEVA